MDDFEQFYLATKDRVFRTVLAASGRRAVAEDAVAEAYARALERWRKVAGHPNPAGWVTLTALNHTRSFWRLGRREVAAGLPETYDDRPAPDEPPHDPAAIRAVLAGLPRRQRDAVALRVLGGMPAEEVGRLLGIAPATVHVHLHRALSTLRERLGDEAHDGRSR